MEQTSNFILHITILQSPVFLLNSCSPYYILLKNYPYTEEKDRICRVPLSLVNFSFNNLSASM